MVDDEDIKIYGRRIVQLNIKIYEFYNFKKILEEFPGSSIELYDNGLPELHNEIENVYFASFRTINDADKFRELFPNRIIE